MWGSVKSVKNVSTGIGSKPNVSTDVQKQLSPVLNADLRTDLSKKSVHSQRTDVCAFY
jgi:hypothetical protein